LSYLLETNTCIRYLNGQSGKIKTRLEQLRREDITLCSVVKAELLFGAAKSSVGERTLKSPAKGGLRFDNPGNRAALLGGILWGLAISCVVRNG